MYISEECQLGLTWVIGALIFIILSFGLAGPAPAGGASILIP